MLLPAIKSSLRATPIYALARPAILMQWRMRGRPVPPPHAAKEEMIRDAARASEIRSFVETGTYLGDMVHRLENDFDEIVSIEVAPSLHARASARFRRKSHVRILLGDSARVLTDLLARVSVKTLFWLDGHYSGGVTGQGELLTPVIKEVELVLGHKVKGHVVLIDDAHCFTGQGDYPTIGALKQIVTGLAPNATFDVVDNVIRIFPR